MKNKWFRRLTAYLAAAVTLIAAVPSLPVKAYAAQSATVRASELNVRSGPGKDYSRIDEIALGTGVTILEEMTGDDGKEWVRITYNGKEGYVQKSYLRTASGYSTDDSFEAMLAAQSFPESYKVRLREIHAEYPAWVFEAQHTGLDWEEVIRNESLVGRNLVDTDSRSSWKSTAQGAYDWANSSWPGFDSSAWVAASEQIIRYYMDPRNFLDSAYVFQFLTQSYDPSIQSAEGVETLVRGTFMESRATGSYGSAGVSTGGPSGEYSQGGPDGAVSSVSTGTPSGGGLAAPGGDTALYGSAPSSESQGAPDGITAAPSQSAPESTESASGAPADLSSAAEIAAPGSGSSSSTVSLSAPSGENTASSGSGQATQDTSSGSSQVTQDTSSGSEVLGILSGPPGYKIMGLIDSSDTPYAVVRQSASHSTGPSSGSTPASSGEGQAPGTGSGKTYVDLIMDAAAQSGVNPYVLTAMIIQEQGTAGKSGLISGNTSGYEGIYNFFNIQAYQSGDMSATERGLWWASQEGSYGRPWDTVEKAIVGGAVCYGENFVKNGQDTFYLKKFDVQGETLYQHQYMTNVEGAADEGFKLGEAYSAALKQRALVFRIPVFLNMPEAPAAAPTGDGSPNNKLRSLSADGFSLTPTFDMDTQSYDLIVDPSVGAVSISAEPIDGSASVSGTGTAAVSEAASVITVNVTAENGDVRSYQIRVLKQGGGQTGGGSPSFSGQGTEAAPGGSSASPVLAGPGGTETQGSSGSAAPGTAGITPAVQTGSVITIQQDTQALSGASSGGGSSSEPEVVLVGPSGP